MSIWESPQGTAYAMMLAKYPHLSLAPVENTLFKRVREEVCLELDEDIPQEEEDDCVVETAPVVEIERLFVPECRKEERACLGEEPEFCAVVGRPLRSFEHDSVLARMGVVVYDPSLPAVVVEGGGVPLLPVLCAVSLSVDGESPNSFASMVKKGGPYLQNILDWKVEFGDPSINTDDSFWRAVQAVDSGKQLTDDVGTILDYMNRGWYDHSDGYCYLSFFQAKFHDLLREVLGPWPELAAILMRPASWFLPSIALVNLRLTAACGGAHVSFGVAGGLSVVRVFQAMSFFMAGAPYSSYASRVRQSGFSVRSSYDRGGLYLEDSTEFDGFKLELTTKVGGWWSFSPRVGVGLPERAVVSAPNLVCSIRSGQPLRDGPYGVVGDEVVITYLHHGVQQREKVVRLDESGNFRLSLDRYSLSGWINCENGVLEMVTF